MISKAGWTEEMGVVYDKFMDGDKQVNMRELAKACYEAATKGGAE